MSIKELKRIQTLIFGTAVWIMKNDRKRTVCGCEDIKEQIRETSSFFVLSSLANLFPLKENWYLSSPPKQNYVSTQDLEAPHASLPPFFLQIQNAFPCAILW